MQLDDVLREALSVILITEGLLPIVPAQDQERDDVGGAMDFPFVVLLEESFVVLDSVFKRPRKLWRTNG